MLTLFKVHVIAAYQVHCTQPLSACSLFVNELSLEYATASGQQYG